MQDALCLKDTTNVDNLLKSCSEVVYNYTTKYLLIVKE
jgi:hypothetical protein